MSMRIGTAQPAQRRIDFNIRDSAKVLAAVASNVDALVTLIDKAGAEKCDVLALPEDTLGLLHWEADNQNLLEQVLPPAVELMLCRLGAAAAQHDLYLVCCNDHLSEGAMYNTAFFLGRDGREIGRYLKVNMPYSELGTRKRGTHFPVFDTPDLGGVGLLICYDMVFPEAIRCLALNGADIVFAPTLGGAAIGDSDISRAAFRTRAVDNFVYLVVSMRQGGSMIIDPKGNIIGEGGSPDDIIITDIDPFTGRDGGNAFDQQRDMRARLFRERSPEAFGVIIDPEPPILAKVPTADTPEEITRRCNGVLTVGAEQFQAADALLKEGKTTEAVEALKKLRAEYPGSWIDRVAGERIEGKTP
ncbi:MAG TPA: hypothetical protein EYG11_14490 [Candidatus Latescibacteria bacterium]|nr:hypothetical protein [Candidatus Handelsmanbacteria bacterium]HIL09907.1 hypothetical protein [Candidatus Latescibacterota bacterium]